MKSLGYQLEGRGGGGGCGQSRNLSLKKTLHPFELRQRSLELDIEYPSSKYPAQEKPQPADVEEGKVCVNQRERKTVLRYVRRT